PTAGRFRCQRSRRRRDLQIDGAGLHCGAERLLAANLMGKGFGMRARRSSRHVFGFVLASSFFAFALGVLGSPAFAATSGWAGETILSTPNANSGGWEPAVAAD